jgi:sulfur carrier protein ThiS adenylyltransferase
MEVRMSSSETVITGRDTRQLDLVPPDRLARCHGVVVGVGSIGRQVALQLSAMGIPAMTLYDHDTVSAENLGPQGFWETDVGDRKVDAVANVCHQQQPRMELHAVGERFRRSDVTRWPPVREICVFVCVDSIGTRRLVWEAVRARAAFLADGRMAAEVLRVLASGRPNADAAYPATLFSGTDAYAGACSSKSTIYAASVAAGLMVGQLARWLRGQPVLADLTFNLLAGELTMNDASD